MNHVKEINTKVRVKKGKYRIFRNVQGETEKLTPQHQVCKILRRGQSEI